MLGRRLLTFAAIICSAIFLNACGSDAHGAYNSPSSGNTAPTAPTNIAGNAGDSAVSLGWEAPTTGSTPITYNIAITPTESRAVITFSGTHALIRNLVNDTTYTFSITAKNNAGESTAITILLKPTAVPTNIASLNAITRDTNDTKSLSGIFDPSLLNVSSRLWMAYSSVNYYQQSGFTVQDVSTSLAYSDNGGTDFSYVQTLGAAKNATIPAGVTLNPCGNIACNGRWVYEVPFLVDDISDPDATRRFKLFAHKYFLYPPATAPFVPTMYTLGAIVMWTAPSPGSTWSSEQAVLSWTLTPPELVATTNINTLDAALNECLAFSEGSATTYQGNLDFVFTCPTSDNTQKIVLLRSSNHANTFKYISTPLTATDAASFGALYFSAPALIPTESNAPVLLATPVINRAIGLNGVSAALDAYSGCVAFPIADEETGKLFRSSTAPLSILQIGYQANHLNGACAWDRGASSSGILLNDGNAISGTAQFSILKTTKNF